MQRRTNYIILTMNINAKHKSQKELLDKKEPTDNHRTTGSKLYNFHQLKSSTNYHNFPKMKSSSMEKFTNLNIDKNVNFSDELRHKKKIISIQKNKFDKAIPNTK